MHKGTVDLYDYLEEHMKASDFKNFWKCFFVDGQPSQVRFKTMFMGSGRTDITSCSAEEVKAVSEFSGISCSELMSKYGMGQAKVSLREANQLIQEEGMEYAPVVHAA